MKAIIINTLIFKCAISVEMEQLLEVDDSSPSIIQVEELIPQPPGTRGETSTDIQEPLVNRKCLDTIT